jgi:hypothetical protein
VELHVGPIKNVELFLRGSLVQAEALPT